MADFGQDDDDIDLNGSGGDLARNRLRKTPDAFRTISEVADELHVPQHVLRFWETKFPQVRPLKRGGGRRYYRPEDVLLLRRVADLLYTQGYTIKGVQRLLREGGGALQDNIPPASPEEQMAAQAERNMLPVLEPEPEPTLVLQPEIPQLPLGGLLRNVAAPAPQPAPKPPEPRAAAKPRQVSEAERLRTLLTETMHALEELRRMLG